jgi:adenylate cyclase
VLLGIGVNLGDVLAQADGDLYVDGVNVTARLESIADPGGIAVSGKVHDELFGKLAPPFVDLGERSLRNLARPVRVYALAGSNPVTGAARLPLPFPTSLQSLSFPL